MEIESTIDGAIEFVQKSGIEIVTNIWGIRNLDDRWLCVNQKCCPLGAVLLQHQIIFSHKSLFAGGNPQACDLTDVRFNPAYSISKFFEVDNSWIKSFIHGLMNAEMFYYNNNEARNLGFKYHQKFSRHTV